MMTTMQLQLQALLQLLQRQLRSFCRSFGFQRCGHELQPLQHQHQRQLQRHSRFAISINFNAACISRSRFSISVQLSALRA